MEVFFLKGTRGSLFSVYYPARDRHRLGLVYVPPFAEEMNRARRMAALQARRLGELGIDVLLLDPFGTGDSDGDFGQARWDIWCDDVRTAMNWLAARTNAPVGLWGLRLGALLAADVASRQSDPIERLVLWQPVLSGDGYLTQFLRLRLAATMDKGENRETTKVLRERLAQGEVLEIAGYHLAPDLARAIASRTFRDLLEVNQTSAIDWLEVTSDSSGTFSPAAQKVLDVLAQQSRATTAKAVAGQPFWLAQEITLAPELLSATDDMLRQ
jgi:exosortase A-associated hydrolase 2